MRCWVDEGVLKLDRVELTPEESRHLLRVRRAQPGDAVELVDGCGTTAMGSLEDSSSRTAVIRITERRHHDPPAVRCTLYQALPKRGKLEWIVQKAVELGTAEVVPIHTRHCVSRWRPEQAAEKVARLQRVALEAAKQSGSPWLTRVRGPLDLDATLGELTAFDLVLWGDLGEGAQPLVEALDQAGPVSSIACLVGPEGDFSPDEVERLRAASLQAISLGPRVLRTETAALCLLSVLACHYRV